MFKTKRDVDRHVTYILNRIRDEKERHTRGFQFGKLYYDVADYESSKKYVQAFLSVRQTVPQAHKLLGQVYEALKDKEKALESYIRSLDLEPEQKDLILKVCELYSDPSVQVNADNAKFWIEKAEKVSPDDHRVFKLKERVIDKNGSGDSEELERLICTELERNPGDVQLQIKLLKLYLESRQVERAYEHATATERNLAFVMSADWYECLCDVYQVYQDQQRTAHDQTFYTNKLFALVNLVHLRIQSEDRDMVRTMKTLHQFDQDLFEASRIRKQTSEWENLLTEMKGQLFYLVALLLLKRALKGQVMWRDASTFSAICFLLSDSLPPVDLRSSWFRQVSEDKRRFYSSLHRTGCDRLSQGGHMIYSLLSKQTDKDWARKLRQKLCTPQGRDSLYSLAFPSGELQREKDTSYLLQSDVYTGTTLDVPSKSDLVKYDSVAYTLHRDSLHHLVWLAMQHHTLKDTVQPDYEQLFSTQLVPDMKFSVLDLSGGDPGSMCQLDIQVFLYACVRWACIKQRDQRRNLHTIPDKPDLLPVCLGSTTCSREQSDWWSSVYGMENADARPHREKLPKVWGVVTRGLETVRLVLPHSLPVALIVHIARTLDARAKEIESRDAEGIVTPKLEAMRARASHYWIVANDVVQRMERNQSIKQPKEMLFPLDLFTDKEFSKDLKEHVKFAMAMVAMRDEKFEEALDGFDGLYTPAAAYHTGLIYRNLAETVNENGNSSVTGQNSQQVALLSKAKTALYQTLDRLETEQDEELKEAARRDLDDVVCKLIALESGGPLVDSMVSPTAFSTPQSGSESEEEPMKQPSPRTPVLPTPSRSWEQTRVSPTRLDVQLKALEHTNTAVSSRLSMIEETVRTQERLIQELFSQLREYRDQNNTLKAQLQTVHDSVQNVAAISMAARPSMQPQYPATPHQRSMMNAMNASFGAAQYDYTLPSGLPPHMSQYSGYPASSPRPGSAYGQQNVEDEFSNIDGQFYIPDEEEDFNIPDQNLIQEWPFGNKPGLEGKSTITYSPQHQARGINQGNAGIFANVFRGQSIQYGGYQPQVAPQQVPPQLPGPGFFSQHSQQTVAQAMQTQAGRFPGQPQVGLQLKPGVSPALSPSVQPPRPTIMSQAPAASKPVTPMMPPNAVASHLVESKPLLNPGSVGVPPPLRKDETGPAVSQPGVISTPGSAPLVSATATKPSLLPTSSSLATPGQNMPGAAASMLSQLAAKHQENVNTGQTAATATVPMSTPQKTVFQGFTFSSTPKITETKPENPEEEVKVTTAADAPKPFSGFSFTTPTLSASKSPSTQTQSTASPFGLGQNTTSSFGGLTAGAQTAAGFGAGAGDFKGFAGAGQPMFTKSPSPRRRDPSIGSDDHVDEYEPNVDFQPVVPLPDLVEVKTGEEDEEKLFGERAKLFRFDKESKQWKERGVGEIKVLKHKKTNLCRILMRREQVLKLCANHKITKDLKLTPMSTSEKAWVWTAADFSEGEVKAEKLAVRFKTQDIAENFKKTIETCQEKIVDHAQQPGKTDSQQKKEKTKGDEPVKKPEKKEEQLATADKTSESAASGQKGNLASMFKPQVGSWTCSGCYVRNNGDVLKCPCCNSLKPGVNKEDIPDQAPAANTGASGSSGFTFGSQLPIQTGSSGGFMLVTKPADTATSGGTGGFRFGNQTIDTAATTSTSGSGFTLGTPATTSSQTGGFKFGSQSSVAVTTSATSGSDFVFGKPGTVTSTAAPGGFPFGGAKTTLASSSGTASSTATSSLAGFRFGGDTSKGSGTSQQMASTPSESGFNLPEPCKPTSGFTFGGAAAQSAESSAVTSAGFNVNKDTSSYSFGETAKPADENSKEQSRGVGGSLLAKYLSAPDTNVEEVSSTTDDGKGNAASKGTFGQSAGSSSSFKFGSPSMPPSNLGSAAGNGEKEADKKSGNVPTTPVKPTEGFKFSMTPKGEAEKPQPAAKLGGGFNFSLNMTPGMPSKTSPLKSSGVTSPKSPEVTDDGYYVTKEDDDSHIHFEPIIQLPEKVEVKTGEEDEDVMYSHRAKLYRFTKGEWKERGLGDVKVLYCADTHKARIVMRREQILKLCCNHYITPELKFKQMPDSSGKILSWYAMDFSDGEPKTQQFSIRFKMADIAEKFQKAVEDAKERLKTGKCDKSAVPAVETIGATADSTSETPRTSDEIVFVKEVKATAEEITKARELMLPDHFFLYKLKQPCPGCRGCEDESKSASDQVQADNDDEDEDDEDEDDEYDNEETEEDEDDDEDYEDEEEEEEETGPNAGGDTRESQKGPGTQLLTHLLSTGKPGKNEDETPTQAGIFAGGFPPAQSTVPAVAESSGFVFGGPSVSGMSFSSLASATGPVAFQKDENKPFHWHGAGQQLFGGGAGAKQEGSGDEDDVQQGAEPHFEPIVPLPELIEVKTGEEDETIEFAQRAKLFRFASEKNEWKEKGIGEMKILKHKETGKYRFLLRREQVHKLACNHMLTPDLFLQPLNTSETSWCWLAQDFSENDPKIEKLAVKFKTIDLANSFKSKVDEIQAMLRELES